MHEQINDVQAQILAPLLDICKAVTDGTSVSVTLSSPNSGYYFADVSMFWTHGLCMSQHMLPETKS